MGIGSGPELDLLDLDDLLLLLGLGFLLLRLVFELAEVHDLADRGRRIRADLDQVEPGLLGQLHPPRGGDEADVLTLGADQADFGDTDAVVDPGAGIAHRRGVVGSAGYDAGPSAVKGKWRAK